ncbi:MAG: hypothetical protein GX671_05165 [Clostridiales bacterium]|nr:hypothetical protein [Clostridiales bacterium]
MKKKILTAITTMCLVFAMIPSTVFAGATTGRAASKALARTQIETNVIIKDVKVTLPGSNFDMLPDFTVIGAKYTGNPIVPPITINLSNGSELVCGRDYTITFADNIMPGTASYVITGTGRYGGMHKGTFVIDKADIGRVASVMALGAAVYNGRQHTPKFSLAAPSQYGPLIKGKDYTVTYGDNVEVGLGYITVNGMGNRFKGSAQTAFYIERANIASASTAAVADELYTGLAFTPQPQWAVYEGMNLINGQDYTLSYINNVAEGTASVVMTGIGKYQGTKVVPFRIVKRPEIVTGFKVKKQSKNRIKMYWHKASNVEKYQIRICQDKKFRKSVKKYTIKNYNSALKVASKYRKCYIQIRGCATLNGKTIYGPWSRMCRK